MIYTPDMKLTPFIEKVGEDDYNVIPALRSTMLKEFMKSPSHYKWMIDHPETSDAAHFILGSFVHALLLEPETVADKFIKCDMKTRHNKEYYALKSKAAPLGKSILLTSEWEDGQRIADSAMSDPYIRKILEMCYAEITAVAKIADVWCKCRIDGYVPEEKTIVDIKTTGDSVYWFPNNMRKFSYDISAPFYTDITNMAGGTIDRYQFIVLEKKPPFAAKIFTMTQEYLAAGRTRYVEALGRFKKCLDTNEWKGYDNSAPELLYPPHLIREEVSTNNEIEENLDV